ncbi:MAG: hypothetical protein EX285_06670 [Thaumarchaeota archaeon]|nr:hypothetical protein [Nitrososphaerota archaeon]
MITIQCVDINDLKPDLAAYLSEKLPAVPVIRTNDIVLDPLTRESEISIDDVCTYIETFLTRENINDCILSVDGNKILINTTSKRKINVIRPDFGLLACPHCGLVTPYKEEMDVHIRIHYLF